MVGGEQESQQLIDYLLGEYEEDTDKLWQSNIFGKSLRARLPRASPPRSCACRTTRGRS